MIWGLKKRKSVTVSTFSPCIYHEVMGKDAMILVFLMFSFKSTFSLSSFTFIKRFFSSSTFSAIHFSSVAKYCPTLCDPMDCSSQACLSSAVSWSLLKFMSFEMAMLSNHLIHCHPFFLLPSIFPSIKLFPGSWLFKSGGQRIGASVTVLPMNIQD